MKLDLKTALLRLIAAAEMVGGAWGIYRVGVLLQRSGWTMMTALVCTVLTLVFGLFLVAGILLWRRRPAGIWLSVAVQALQLPHIVTSPFGFLLGSPASVAVGLSGDWTWQSSTLWHPGIGFSIDSEVELAWIGANLLALAALLILIWQIRTPVKAAAID